MLKLKMIILKQSNACFQRYGTQGPRVNFTRLEKRCSKEINMLTQQNITTYYFLQFRYGELLG